MPGTTSPEKHPEHELVHAARSGNRKALESLLARYEPHVYRFGMKMCGDPEDAKDVLQETLLAAARGVRDFRGGASVSTWLYTIARSFCIKKRRRGKYAPAREESLEGAAEREVRSLVDPQRGPDEALAGRQLEAALEKAIGGLQPMYREVLLLRDVEGLTAPEVAQVLNLSVEAVKSRLHRARMAVRAQLAPLLGAESEPSRPGCPDVVHLLSQHMEGEISSEVCARMERHVEACPHCRSACDSLRQTLALCRTAPAPKLPAPVEQSVRKAIADFLARSRAESVASVLAPTPESKPEPRGK